MMLSRKFYINQLLNEHNSVILVVKILTKITENTGKYLWGLSVELGNLMAKNHGSDVDHIPDC
jgi:hypothetical protein